MLFQLVLEKRKAALVGRGVLCGGHETGNSLKVGVLRCLLQSPQRSERYLPCVGAQSIFAEGTNR